MRPLLLLCSFLLLAGFQAKPLDKKVVGSWKYDMASFKLEIDPAARAKEEKKVGKEAFEKQLADVLAQMKEMIAPMVFVFSADHRMSVSAPQMTEKVKGKWSMKGVSILVVMDKEGQASPELTLAKDGKKIKTVYRHPGFGVGRADMVRK